MWATRGEGWPYAHIRQHMTARADIIMPAFPKASKEVVGRT
jgi:hypothetical protein